jgi:alanine racemase
MENYYYRAEAFIHQEALRKNIRTIRESLTPGTLLMGVVKANAYGHGIENVWPILKEEGVDRLAVAVVQEGVRMRKMGIHLPILLLGYTDPTDCETLIENQLTATVFTYEMAKALSDTAVRSGKKAVVHIALDTGMRRIGFRCNEDSIAAIEEIVKLPGIEVEGLFTHFAEADQADKTAARKQLEEFLWMDDRLREKGIEIPIRHVSNSAGVMELPEAHFEMVRAGIILYGIAPSEEMDTLKFPLSPVMELKAHVVYIKEIEDGEAVSYGGTYVAKGKRRIGTVPLGYADGYSRALSNKGYVLVRGKRAPIAGRICMDQFMIDLTDIPEAQEGDEILLFGQGLPLEELADTIGTISYELACQISSRVPRRSCK